MSLSNRSRALLALALIGTAVGAAMFLRGRAAVRGHDAELKHAQQAARASIDSLTYLPLGEFPALLLSDPVLARAIAADSSVSPDEAKAVAAAAVEFLGARFGEDATPEQYMAWRARQGFRLRPLDELKRRWFVEQAYTAYSGAPVPDGATPEQLFVECVQRSDRFEKGRFRPTGVAADERWIDIQITSVTRANPAASSPPSRVADAASLSGRISTSFSWFMHDGETARQLEQEGHARTASVWFVLEFRSGHRRPVRLGLVHHGQSNAWLVTEVGIACSPGEESVRWEF